MRKYAGILIGGVAATFFCYVWYSPALFRDAWQKGLWITSAKIAAQMETGLWDTWLFAAFAFIILSLGIRYFLAATHSKKFPQKMCVTFLLWGLIVSPILFLDFLWEFRRIDLLYLDSVFLLVTFLLITALSEIL